MARTYRRASNGRFSGSGSAGPKKRAAVNNAASGGANHSKAQAAGYANSMKAGSMVSRRVKQLGAWAQGMKKHDNAARVQGAALKRHWQRSQAQKKQIAAGAPLGGTRKTMKFGIYQAAANASRGGKAASARAEQRADQRVASSRMGKRLRGSRRGGAG